MPFARPPVRQAGEATLELHGGWTPHRKTTLNGAEEHVVTSNAAARTGLKQETIAIVAVGVTLMGTMLFTTSRLEARIDRVVAEARADRELFTREILRLTAEQSRLAGMVEGGRTEQAR